MTIIRVYAAWRDRLQDELAEPDREVFLVGHSLGGSVLLKYLSEEEVDEYVLQEDFALRLPAELPVLRDIGSLGRSEP